jgi:hypothetical protein
MNLSERPSNRRIEFGQARFHVTADVNAQGASITIHQHLQIASCLRCFDDAEGVCLSRYGYIMGIIASNLQEYS